MSISNHFKLSYQKRKNIKEEMITPTSYKATLILYFIMEENLISGYGYYGMGDKYGGIERAT